MRKKDRVPNGWKSLKLEELLTQGVRNGYSPNCPEEPNGSWVLCLANLTENGLDPSQAKPAPLDDNKTKDFLLRPGDFLISRSNTLDKVGRVALFRGEIENCSYPDLIMRFRVDETRVANEYLEDFLKSPTVRRHIQSCASGTSGSMVKISKKVVEKIPIILPSLPEQKAIADLLSTWDEAIEKTERLIQAKVKRFQWLLRTLISEPQNTLNTQKADLERSGQSVPCIPWLEKEPQNTLNTQKNKAWEKVRLGKICNVTKGKQLNVVHMNEAGAYYALNGGMEPSGRTDNWNTEAETITISEGGNSCGYVNYNKERFWSGGHCYSLLNLKSGTSKHYLYFYLKMNEPKLMRLRVGSGLPNIQKKDVDSFVVVLPSLAEQERIADTLSVAQHEIDLLKQLSNKFKTQKRGLMQKLLTGEWRIKPEIINQHKEV